MGMPVGVSRDSYNSLTTQINNPDPSNYEIIKSLQINENLVILIKYPDCNNYEGKKVLLYKNISLNKLITQKQIDPHFSENKKFKSPIARFEPTTRGWLLAIKTMQLLKYY